MKLKSIKYSGALIAALCVAAAVKADDPIKISTQIATPVIVYAQIDPQPEAPVPPVPPSKPDAPVEQDPATRMKRVRESENNVRAAEQADRAQAEMQRVQEEVNRAQAEFGRAGASFDNWSGTFNGLANRPERSVIIRTTETDGKNIAAAEEDLNVMGRILEKALYQTGEDGAPRAMGIRVNINVQSGAKNLQIEGFGALFMLNVNFPLMGPPAKTEESESKEPTNSTWEETKHELYGQPSDPKRGPNPRNEFDPKRVDQLKDSLFEALKNAANMKSLKSDENVMVVVTSGGKGDPSNPFMTLMQSGNKNTGGTFGSSGGGGGGRVSVLANRGGNGSASTLTIRARKSEIDSFAKGKISMAEFRGRCQVLVY